MLGWGAMCTQSLPHPGEGDIGNSVLVWGLESGDDRVRVAHIEVNDKEMSTWQLSIMLG